MDDNGVDNVGTIIDSYWFEGKLHGPHLFVYPDGGYNLEVYVHNKRKKALGYFNEDGTER